jgi:hypothetical protein
MPPAQTEKNGFETGSLDYKECGTDLERVEVRPAGIETATAVAQAMRWHRRGGYVLNLAALR